MSKTIEWNGVSYFSMSEAARALNLNRQTLIWRLRKGHTCDADVHKYNRHPTVWNGVEYESMTAAANFNHISRSGLRKRLRKGYTCDKDMEW